MTPLQLEVAIRFYWDPDAKTYFDRIGNAGHEAAIHFLRLRGLLKTDENGAVVANNEPLAIFVQALQNVMLPVQGWRMP